MSVEKIILFNNKSDCCGCAACMNVCPKGAIAMTKDEYGFIYPQINRDKCVECGLCMRVCSFQNKQESGSVKSSYAAAATDKKLLAGSASGGVFAVAAKKILSDGGVVFGCSMETENNELTPRHIMISHLTDLKKLQGSKYVQSFIGDTYQQVKQQLQKGVPVLFSGTPCQIAGLYGYLQNKDYDNLYTMDLICHGVPSADIFRDFIRLCEKKCGGKIVDYYCRDKKHGWGNFCQTAVVEYKNGKRKEVTVSKKSSYCVLFLEAAIYRESCYSCKYTNQHRVGDITIGDFWGIEKHHPEYLSEDGKLKELEGISCMLVNTEKGKMLLESLDGEVTALASEFKYVADDNGQLKFPSKVNENRSQVLELYRNKGYAAVDKWHNKRLGVKRYIYTLWDGLPLGLKSKLKRILKNKK